MGRVRNDRKSVTRCRPVQLKQSSHADMQQHTKYKEFQILTEVSVQIYMQYAIGIGRAPKRGSSGQEIA